MTLLTREHTGTFITPVRQAHVTAAVGGRTGTRRPITRRQARRIRALAAVVLTLAVIAALLLVHLLG